MWLKSGGNLVFSVEHPIFTANEISSNSYKATEKAYAIDANYKINANAK